MAFSQMQRSGTITPKDLNLPRNVFNLSCGKYLETSLGMLVPFDVVRMFPGDTIDANYAIKIESKLPLLVPIKNNMRMFVKSYFASDSMLWAGAHNHISKGVRQDQDLEMPKFLPYVETTPWEDTVRNYRYMTITPNSPLNYMGVPWFGYAKIRGEDVAEKKWSFQPVLWHTGHGVNPEYKDKIKYKDEKITPTNICALPLVMYVKIKRKDFIDSNLLMQNTKWFPNEEDHFRLPYNCRKNNYGTNSPTNNYVNALDWEKPLRLWGELPLNQLQDRNGLMDNIPSNMTNEVPRLNTMYFVPRRRDYYWGSSPFVDLIRTGNNLPSLNMNVEGSLDFSGTVYTGENSPEHLQDKWLYADTINGSNKITTANSENANVLLEALQKAQMRLNSTSVNMMALRNVMAETLVLERIGLIHNTDFYNGYMQTIYGENPNSESGDPIYIGGFYNDVIMDTVQNLADTGESPVGFKSAVAQGVINGNIGRFTCNEFGWFMSVMYIIPDTIYTNNMERMWRSLTQKDQWNPLLQATEPDAIKKFELGLPQKEVNEWNIVDTPFGYTRKDEYAKWRNNKIIGFCESNDPTEFVLDQAYFIKTNLSTNECALNEKNLEIHHENTICTAFADFTDYQFRVDIGCNIKMARNMVKEATPSSMGMGI